MAALADPEGPPASVTQSKRARGPNRGPATYPEELDHPMNIFDQFLAILADIIQFVDLFAAIVTFLSFFGLTL